MNIMIGEKNWVKIGSKVNRNDKTDGLSEKQVKAYRQILVLNYKYAVTKDPKKLKKGSKSAKRRLIL